MRETTGTASNLRDLPLGGGSLSPLGDRFQPDLVKGTGNYGVPLHFPKGPNELQPQLSLTYSTGSGNGPFGLGWRLNAFHIERRTDRGVPTYNDAEDEFILGGAGILVPVGGGRYRPQADTTFWMIEKLENGWRIRTGDGRQVILGRDEAARESAPGRDFAWYLQEESDRAGNTVRYSYLRDGGRLYLEEIRYSVFRIRFVYEQRLDVLRNGRAGFERVIRLRATRIELHSDSATPTLLRQYELSYRQAMNLASLLVGISLTAQQNGETARLPNLSFEYSEIDFDNWVISEPKAELRPPSIESPATQFVDLTGDGLPDILDTSGGRFRRWVNEGDGVFGGPVAIHEVPSLATLERNNVGFADLNANGRVDLFAADQPLQFAFEADGQGGFRPEPIVFSSRPSLRLAAANTRLMDVDGDGVTDLIATERTHHLLFRHEPGQGWQEPIAVRRVQDLETFPDISFEDRGTALADMTGDGLQDIVLLESGCVSYWPYVGNGAWAPRVRMDNSPVFPEGFRYERLHLVDLDGSSCADLVYVDFDRTLVWINQCGQSFADPIELPVGVGTSGRILALDLYGDGRPGLVWSITPGEADQAGYRTLRLDPNTAPFLMTRVNNEMGGLFEIEYSTSAVMRLRDRADGREWAGELPITVHVVETIRDIDTVTGRISERRIRYHDGVYDGPEREFRGFAEVTVESPGDESTPTSRVETAHFMGDPNHEDAAERERQRALTGSVLRVRRWAEIAGGFQLDSESEQTWEARLEDDTGPRRVFFPFVSRIETIEFGRNEPSRVESTSFEDFDAFGNPGRRIRESRAQGAPPNDRIRSEERFTYVRNEAEWLVKLGARMEYRDGSGVPVSVQVRYYDGDPFIGLPEGQVHQGLLSRVIELRMLESAMPAGYADGRDFTQLGYTLDGAGDTRGFYATTFTVHRDAMGNIVEQRDPMGVPLRFEYDADGLYPIRTFDELGNETQMTFDPRSGEPARTELPEGRVQRSEFDPLGRLRAQFETDANGVEQLIKCWVYDAGPPASLTSIAPAAPGRTSAELLSVPPEALNGVSVSRQYYDGFGQEAGQYSRAPDDIAGGRRFSVHGRAESNPRGLVRRLLPPQFVPDLSFSLPPPRPVVGEIRYRYDLDGNLVELLGPGTVHFRVMRDTFSIRHYHGANAGPFGGEPMGSPSRVETFDSRGRLTAIEEEQSPGQPVRVSYELAIDGRLLAVRDGNDAVLVQYEYAGPGDPVRIMHRDVGTRTYYYDAAGRTAERREPDGEGARFTYDPLGRLLRIDRLPANGSPPEQFRRIHYDQDPGQHSAGRFLHGRISLIEDQDVTIRFSYSPGGRTIEEHYEVAGQTLAVHRDLDLQGRLASIRYPDGRLVSYDLDDSGSIRRIPGFADQIRYGADGAVLGYRQANGVEVLTPRAVASNRVESVSAERGGAVLRRIDYSYDEIGAVSAIRDERPDGVEFQEFGYDGLYRLESFRVSQGGADGPLLRAGAYNYDELGNLLRIEETGPTVLQYADAARPGRLTSVTRNGAAAPLQYNGRGQMSSFGNLASIEYDLLGRAPRFVKTDGIDIRISYDHENRRVRKEVRSGGGVSRILYVTGLFERHATHTIRHVFLGPEMIASERADDGGVSAVFYLSDRLGGQILATDEVGNIVANQRYAPFGSLWTGSDQLSRFLGRHKDEETGLIHFGARYYSPTLGRFISADWFALENPRKPMRLPQAYNLYAYALNNPLSFKDTTGLFVPVLFGVIAAIVTIAAVATAAAFAVGFVAGLIYGLSRGQGWESLLTALETALLTTIGMWLGGVTGFLVGGPIGLVIGASMGGLNGLISGMTGIYDWTSWKGWAAFLSDSTWGLIGTTLGNIVHIVNVFWPDSNYRYDLSHRQNRHVYEGGMYLKEGFAFTQGNVISNAGQNGAGINLSFISDHEELHIWQNRLFGPLFQVTYVVWAVGGFIVASTVWLTDTDQDWGSLVETAAYYDNPFEYWAYKNDSNWPPSGADPTLAWG